MKTTNVLAIIGENIRTVRKGRKISQERLSEISDMHPSHLSDIENGKVSASLIAYQKISEALSVPLSELVRIDTGKGDGKIDAQLTEVISHARNLDKKKKALFVSASKGLLSGLERGL